MSPRDWPDRDSPAHWPGAQSIHGRDRAVHHCHWPQTGVTACIVLSLWQDHHHHPHLPTTAPTALTCPPSPAHCTDYHGTCVISTPLSIDQLSPLLPSLSVTLL